MKCWRIDLQRKLIHYLHKELDLNSVLKLENHLLDCNYCRSQLAQLRSSHSLIKNLAKVNPKKDLWQSIESNIINESTEQLAKPTKSTNKPYFLHFQYNLKVAAIVLAMLTTSLIATGLFISYKKQQVSNNPNKTIQSNFPRDNFRLVTIDKIPSNTEPHIVTEGYVSELRIAPDGDTTFRLVEQLGLEEPFIVCEIIYPIKLSPPTIGSKVKVYGVSRYDDKVNHKWYEVHPVLNIEPIKH